MTYVPDRAKLQGLSVGRAELFGKPHVLAGYAGSGVNATWFDSTARCPVCRVAFVANAHHVCPKGAAKHFVLRTGMGAFVLKTALFGLCGSGTTGCHNGFHGGARFAARWVWNSDDAARSWWEGELLAAYGAHAPELYGFGFWEVDDRKTGGTFEVVGR